MHLTSAVCLPYLFYENGLQSKEAGGVTEYPSPHMPGGAVPLDARQYITYTGIGGMDIAEVYFFYY